MSPSDPHEKNKRVKARATGPRPSVQNSNVTKSLVLRTSTVGDTTNLHDERAKGERLLGETRRNKLACIFSQFCGILLWDRSYLRSGDVEIGGIDRSREHDHNGVDRTKRTTTAVPFRHLFARMGSCPSWPAERARRYQRCGPRYPGL